MPRESKIRKSRRQSEPASVRMTADLPLLSEMNAVTFLSKEAAKADIPFTEAWCIAEAIALRLQDIAKRAGDHPNRHKYEGF